MDHLVDAEISIGDYVLTNGGIAAVILVDAVVRLFPGVLGHEQSADDDSFSDGCWKHRSTRGPAEFRGWKVPDVLLSGNHAEIAKWRKEQARKRTRENRPDLLRIKYASVILSRERGTSRQRIRSTAAVRNAVDMRGPSRLRDSGCTRVIDALCPTRRRR